MNHPAILDRADTMRDRGQAYSFLIAALCATAFLIVFLDEPLGHLTSTFPAQTVWLTFLIIAGLALRGAFRSHETDGNFWTSPASVTLLYYMLRFGWSTLVIFYWTDIPWSEFPGARRFFSELGADQNLPFACKILLLGGIGLYCGLWIPSRPLLELLPRIRWTVDETRFRENMVLYTPLALVLFVVIGSLMPVTLIFSVLLFGWVIWVIIVIAAYWMFSAHSASERLKWLAFLIIVYVASIPLGLATGMSGQFLYPAVLILSGYVLANGRIPWKVVLTALPAVLVGILPLLSLYKETPGTDIGNRVNITLDQYSELDVKGKIEIAVQRVLVRTAGAALPSVYSKYYPAIYPFEMGRTFFLEAQGLIPRFVWPDKPNLSRELNKYSVAVGILPNPDETSVVFDAMTEYYINFGLIGVFCLSVIHGYVLRVLYDWLLTILPLFMGVAVFVTLFLTNPDFFGIFQMLFAYLKIVPVWLGVLYFLSRKS
jgi:hypothetical protein